VTGHPTPVERSVHPHLEFRILGPLEIRRDGEPVALPPPRAQAALVVLLVHANRVVSVDQLCDELWQEQPPPTARSALHVHIAALRRALGPDARLSTRPPGYILELDDQQVDALAFERELSVVRSARHGNGMDAAERLRAVLALWRGDALSEFSDQPCARLEATRLEELRMEALEHRVDIELADGRSKELVAELRQLIAAHPYRERLRAQLMLALYRAGRQAEALEAYQDARNVLVEQLGIEPGDDLRDLHRAILAHDADLSARSATSARSHRRPQTARAYRVPVPPNPTVGREGDVRLVVERLRALPTRLLTLVGAGGVGKTRLAIEAANLLEPDFTDGACFVSLAPMRRPEDVPTATVIALGIHVLAHESPQQAVERFLQAKRLLLIADNFEHLLAAAPFLADVLAACPSLKVLATSREPLALRAEEVYPVAPLTLPERSSDAKPTVVSEVDAVALFSQRARAHDPQFELTQDSVVAVEEICRHTDGLPLAIELAAARCGLLSASEIAERLRVTLNALGAGARDAPARQRTLRATIDWSHELLSDDEKTCFANFAAFAGGATPEAAEAVTGADLDILDSLVAKNLLVRRASEAGAARLTMLHTIREYAAQRFASAVDRESVNERHYQYYLSLAQTHASEQAVAGANRNEHVAVLDRETDNFDVALRWAASHPDAEALLAMTAAVCWYWLNRGRYADAVHWIDLALRHPGSDQHPVPRVHTLFVKFACVSALGRARDQSAAMAEAETTARAAGDPALISRALRARASHGAIASRFDSVELLADEVLDWATASGDPWEIAQASRTKAQGATNIVDLRERVATAAEHMTAVGDLHHQAMMLIDAAYHAMRWSCDHDATAFLRRALPLARALNNPSMWMMLHGNLGLAALLTADTDAAQHAFREELRLCRELVVRPIAYEGLQGLAAIAALRGDTQRAARLAGAASAHTYGQPADVVDDRLEARFFQPARERLGVRAWNAAAVEGSALTFEQAIAEALGETPKATNSDGPRPGATHPKSVAPT
jgi:predicted ATPase/DNA-binding SARP family transcriptional activator